MRLYGWYKSVLQPCHCNLVQDKLCNWEGYIDPACTSLPCNWNKVFKKTIEPKRISEKSTIYRILPMMYWKRFRITQLMKKCHSSSCKVVQQHQGTPMKWNGGRGGNPTMICGSLHHGKVG